MKVIKISKISKTSLSTMGQSLGLPKPFVHQDDPQRRFQRNIVGSDDDLLQKGLNEEVMSHFARAVRSTLGTEIFFSSGPVKTILKFAEGLPTRDSKLRHRVVVAGGEADCRSVGDLAIGIRVDVHEPAGGAADRILRATAKAGLDSASLILTQTGFRSPWPVESLHRELIWAKSRVRSIQRRGGYRSICVGTIYNLNTNGWAFPAKTWGSKVSLGAMTRGYLISPEYFSCLTLERLNIYLQHIVCTGQTPGERSRTIRRLDDEQPIQLTLQLRHGYDDGLVLGMDNEGDLLIRDDRAGSAHCLTARTTVQALPLAA